MSKTMEDVLMEHQRQSSSACLCGWSELGRSHPEHQAAALSAAGFGLVADAKAEALKEAADKLSRGAVRDPLGNPTHENYAMWLRIQAESLRSPINDLG